MPVRQSLNGVGIVIDLSSRDYYGYRDDALALIPILTPLWTDLHPTDPGIVALELFCAVADNLSFYEDRCANENFLATCTQRGSIMKFARFATYSPRQRTSALAVVAVTFSGAGLLTAGFPVGSVSTQEQQQIRYELATDYNALGAGVVSLEFIEGETVTEILGSSDGTADQLFTLSDKPVSNNPDGTSGLNIWVQEGIAPFELWGVVNDFNSSGATDKHYRVFVDEEDTVDIQFGDGVNGKIPSSGTDNIKSISRIGGGEIGNQVGTNLITEILDSSFPFVTSVTNAAAPAGGEEKEGIEEIRANIPAWIRQNDRCVTEDDYALEASLVGGVASAKAARGTEMGGSAYEMHIFVRAAGADPYPSGSWNARTETGVGLLGQVGSACNTKREGPVRLYVTGPYKVRPFLDILVHIHNTFFAAQVQERVERALSACLNGFSIDAYGKDEGNEDDIPIRAVLPGGFPRNMGDDLKLSYLNHMLESIDGVDYVDITRMQRDPYARKVYNFGSDATFSQIVVGTDTLRDNWSIRFLSPTTFSVTGDVGGVEAVIGTVGVAYQTAGQEIGFTITAGSIPNFAGNLYEITVGPYLDNLVLGKFELLTDYVGTDTVYASQNLSYDGGIS